MISDKIVNIMMHGGKLEAEIEMVADIFKLGFSHE